MDHDFRDSCRVREEGVSHILCELMCVRYRDIRINLKLQIDYLFVTRSILRFLYFQMSIRLTVDVWAHLSSSNRMESNNVFIHLLRV